MIPSIRTFLLINLLLSVTLITSFAVIGNLFLEHKVLQSHLDAQLSLRAVTIQTLMSGYVHKSDLEALQKKINHLPQLTNVVFYPTATSFPRYENVEFQAWDKQDKLILNSTRLPTFLQPPRKGFADHWIDGELWRTYTTSDPETGLTVTVAEKFALRDELESEITQNSILITVFSFPFLGLLIWIIVGRGLDSLGKVAKEVRYRAPTYLEPVNLASVPTEIKPLIDELNKLFKRLHEGFEREKRFTADATHELRTPLAALRAHTEVALRAKSPEEQQEALRNILAGIDRSSHVIQQLSILSQMMPEAIQETLVPTNIVKQAAEVIADLVPEAISKNTDIELISPDSVIIQGIPTAISILVRNLVDNAIRYTPNGSLIKVEIEETPSNVLLKVIDNGPGIPDELHERVFERFFRVIDNKSPGSGLGLGIVQQIVYIHKAKIILGKPPEGTGLVFTVVFPKS